MDRRAFVRTLATTGLMASSGLAVARAAPPAAAPRVAVIGAGIVGCSIALQLARRGARVTIIDRRGPAAEASGNSFAWINEGDADQPEPYQRLRALAMAEQRRVGAELGLPVRWGGALEWQPAGQDSLLAGFRRMRELGAAQRLLGAADVARIEPALRVEGVERFLFHAADGAMDAVAATRIFLDRAVALGARLHAPAAVRGLEARAGGYRIEAGAERVDVDRVVIAAGTGTPALAAMLGIALRQSPTPGITLLTKPMARVANTVIWAPGIHLHQRDDGRVVLGEEHGPPLEPDHAAPLASQPADFPDAAIAARHAELMLARARALLPALADAQPEHIGIGWRPMPQDGLPVLGASRRAPGAYFAFMHSGVTLSALVGRYAATEIIDDVELAPLAAFRIERFAPARAVSATAAAYPLQAS